MMRTVRLWVAYDGTNYAGWQRQVGADTIQEELERAFGALLGRAVTVHGAGRTDSGVHALSQSAHVQIEKGPPSERLHLALNAMLPRDIRVLGTLDTAANFHSRFDAIGKRYRYRIRTEPVPFPIGRRYFHWHPYGPLDLSSMRAAARHIVGTHDFACFATNSRNSAPRSTVRTLRSVHLFGDERGVDITVQGDGFLYNMVRTIAGSLLDIGRGKRGADWILEVLQSGDRRTAGAVLPPEGLTLVRVLYPASVGPMAAPGYRR